MVITEYNHFIRQKILHLTFKDFSPVKPCIYLGHHTKMFKFKNA